MPVSESPISVDVGTVEVYVIQPHPDGWRVLMLQRADDTIRPGSWEVVTGSIDGAERPEQAAVREAREETGLAADRLYCVAVQPFYLPKRSSIQMSVVFAAFVDDPGAVALSHEHQRFEWLGVLLRRLLAGHIFKRCGENFKAFQHVEFSFGYNLEVGNDVVVHRHVLLDDRGGIRLGNDVSISDYANVYSHTHSIVDPREVTNVCTTIGDGVRITYHATILAGVHVARQGMVGAMAVATSDVRPYHVHVGIPAKSVRVKPNAPSHDLVSRTATRPPIEPGTDNDG